MTFSKSNLNVLSESLFTELTADQAEMLEGGKRVTVLSVNCITAGADPDGTDELTFRINRVRDPRNPISMRTGSSINVANSGIAGNFDSHAFVELFDRDEFISPGVFKQDLIGRILVLNNGTQTTRISGNGSTYDVTYKVTN